MGWLLHWLAVHTGTINETGPYYGFLSGAGSDIGELAVIGALVGIYRKHMCEVKGCPRIARHESAGGHHVCRKHMPGGAPTHKDVIDAHHHALRRRSGEACERVHASPQIGRAHV